MERSSDLSTSYSQFQDMELEHLSPGLLLSNTSGITCTKLLSFFCLFYTYDYIFTFMLLVFHFFK